MNKISKFSVYFPLFLVAFTQLHLLRNVTAFYFVAFVVFCVLFIYYVFLNYRLIREFEKKIILFVIVIFLYPIIPIFFGVILDEYEDLKSVLVGLSRLIFSLPMVVAILISSPNRENVKKLVFLTGFITFIASLSIPYQFIFGAIPWFAESSERAGVDRFASLFGSLTALGLVVGYGIFALVITTKRYLFSAMLVVGTIVGALLSTQKAAIVNIILCLIALIFTLKFRFKYIAIYSLFIIIFISIFGYYFFTEINLFLSSVQLTPSSEYKGDVSFVESIYERLVDLPLVAISHHGWSTLFFGVGPVGGSGALGYPEVPMSHNGVVDLFLIGGIAYFLIFSFFLGYVFKLIFKLRSVTSDQHLFKFGIFVFVTLMINLPFSNLIFFPPSSAMFFAVSLKCFLVRNEYLLSKLK
jgi:hypothetical protein